MAALSTLSKAFEKSTNMMVPLFFETLSSSMIRLIARICGRVDLFFRNPFWYLLRIGSRWGVILFRRREL